IRAPRGIFPAMVVLGQDGKWAIDEMYWSLTHRPLVAGESFFVDGSEGARVMVAVDEDGDFLEPLHPRNAPRGSGGITILYDHSDAPASIDASDVTAAIERAADVYRELLKDDSTSLTFRVVWDHIAEQTTLAFSTTRDDDRQWNLLRNRLTALFGGVDADGGGDSGVYNSLPLSSKIDYARPGNANDQTDDILLSAPMLLSLFGVDPGTPLKITFNNNISGTWNFDMANARFPETVINSDFIGVLIHEIGHHLGFLSHVEALEFLFVDMITFWDVFRFNEDDNGPFITSSEMIGAKRELRQSEAAIAATAISSTNFTYPLSRGTTFGGDDRQASHWKDDELPLPDGSPYVGIMDPTHPASMIGNGSWLQQSDIWAFDLIGWVIDPFSLDPAASTPASLVPDCTGDPMCEVDPDQPIALDWSSTQNTDSYSVYVFEASQEGSGGTPVEVFGQSGLTSSMTTIPAGTLDPGMEYDWFVNSENWNGFSRSEIALIRTSGGPCNLADLVEPYGVLDLADITAFLVAFSAMDPAADVAEPFGTFDLADIVAFVAAHDAGCP
ncbi:MAG: NF038122 family metalloprotease, partial [Phycisphaerales bacterium]|nr:NF038122 family metalloprotease [Phycisphaerales bacterium]